MFNVEEKVTLTILDDDIDIIWMVILRIIIRCIHGHKEIEN